MSLEELYNNYQRALAMAQRHRALARRYIREARGDSGFDESASPEQSQNIERVMQQRRELAQQQLVRTNFYNLELRRAKNLYESARNESRINLDGFEEFGF